VIGLFRRPTVIRTSFTSLVLLSAAAVVRADAPADLAAGRTALTAGDLDKALPLLVSAAQDLPNSVEAHVALAECRLRRGELDASLASWRTVVRLSPDHVRGKAMVAALTGQAGPVVDRLASARAFLDAGAYQQAESVLLRAVDDPTGDAGVRASARLLLAEVRLLQNSTMAALADALRVIQDSKDPAITGPARVIAALTLMGGSQAQMDKAAEFVRAAGNLAAPWSTRAELVALWADLDDPAKAAGVSAKLRGPLASIPPGALRSALTDRLAAALLAHARRELGRGEPAAAAAIVWPMVSSKPMPGADADLKPLELGDGWLPARPAETRIEAARLLAEVGRSEFAKQGGTDTIAGFWAASEVLRQLADADMETGIEPSIQLAAELAALSRPAPGRKSGTVLSSADRLQRQILLSVVGRASHEESRRKAVELILAQVERYRKVDDLETGLAQFFIAQPAAGEAMRFVAGLDTLRVGPADARLAASFAAAYAQLGNKTFAEAASRNVSPIPVNRFDRAALGLYARLSRLYPADAASWNAGLVVVERYAARSEWASAAEASAILHSRLSGSAGKWATVRLMLRQAAHEEDARRTAHRKLDDKLPATVRSAIAQAVAIFAAEGEPARSMLTSVLQPLAARYVSLGRADLADAVVTEVAASKDAGPLADWILWARIGLVDPRAAVALASSIAEARGAPPALHDTHKSELVLLHELIVKHPESPYAPMAIAHVKALADLYAQRRAFDVARTILGDLLKAQPKLPEAQAFEFEIALLALSKARDAFRTRADKNAAVDKLPDAYAAAIDALTAYLKARPAGALSDRAEAELFGIAVEFGRAGAWAASREALDRFAAAIPDYRSASHLKFLRAMTYIGELDRPYAVAHMSPTIAAIAVEEPSAPLPALPVAPRPLRPRPGNANDQQQQMAEPDEAEPAAAPAVSEAELKRRDDTADKAYALLLDVVRTAPPADTVVAANARGQVIRLFGWFERYGRPDKAADRIKKWLADRPADPQRVELAFRAILDRLVWAGRGRGEDRIDTGWLQARHELFDAARAEIAAFVAAYPDRKDQTHRALMAAVDSFIDEARLAAPVSAIRAGGLLVRSAEALIALIRTAPDHPETANFPDRLWAIADRLKRLDQEQSAVYVLSEVPRHFPTHRLAGQSVLRIAEIHASNLADPIRAVDAYLEYLGLVGDNEDVRARIHALAGQLNSKRRYIEALHIYGVFVDAFPTDPRAGDSLREMGRIHQTNEAWQDALTVYRRVLDEYPGTAAIPQVKLAMAEARINLGRWREARRSYEEFLAEFPGDGSVGLAGERIAVLKHLERYQSLLDDNAIQRNKDDAQFQIGRLVMDRLGNPVKAVEEFAKVVANFPKSDLADDAQLEIGKALLALNRMDEARAALFGVPRLFPNSPLADDALYLVAQSYERQAERLGVVTVAAAKEECFEQNQRGAYKKLQELTTKDNERLKGRRDGIKSTGKDDALALEDAYVAGRAQSFNAGNTWNFAKAAEQQFETETALQVASRQDRINDAYREAAAAYLRAAGEYPLGDMTDKSLLRLAQILEVKLKDRAAAIGIYQRIVKLFPGTPAAEDAAWKVAGFHEEEQKYTLALDAYRDFIRNHPGSQRVADAQFAMAEVLEQLGRWVDAMDAYETFRQKFPQHTKAVAAAEQISWIKAYRK